MESLSPSEENYLKGIHHLSGSVESPVTTNSLSEHLKIKPASATDMIRKFAEKGLVEYEKYKGVILTDKGRKLSLEIIRRQRLWKVFLVEKLKFNWNEISEVSDQLEHIASTLLISRLDQFLGYPRLDPTGESIPDESGEQQRVNNKTLNEFTAGKSGILVSIVNTTHEFLRYLDKSGITIGSKLRVIDKIDFDQSMEIQVDERKFVTVSREAAENLLMTEL
jgi:DtxR family Mn-dependent transcriptional regulator